MGNLKEGIKEIWKVGIEGVDWVFFKFCYKFLIIDYY